MILSPLYLYVPVSQTASTVVLGRARLADVSYDANDTIDVRGESHANNEGDAMRCGLTVVRDIFDLRRLHYKPKN